MQTIIRTLIATLVLLLVAPLGARAEMVKAKGKGEVVYTGIFKPGSAEERAAIAEAKKNALMRYVSSFDSARFELYKRVEKDVLANLDQYVPDFTQLDQQTDKTSKRYTVVIEASINAAMIESAIQQNSAAAAPAKGDSSYLTFVFVARELASAKAFDAKRTTVELHEAASSGNEKNAVAEDGQSASRSLETTAMNKKTTGGNTERKANELTYRVTTVTEVDNAVNSVLTKAHYETVDPTDAGLEVDAFKTDFSAGNDISAATRKAAIATLKEKGITYLAIANMDVGLPSEDEVSGMQKVFVTVTAKVTDLTPKFPKTVASIAGKPYSGIGSDPQVAKINALNEAAKQSAVELVDQLRMKNVH